MKHAVTNEAGKDSRAKSFGKATVALSNEQALKTYTLYGSTVEQVTDNPLLALGYLSPTQRALLTLQRTYGNQFVQRMLKSFVSLSTTSPSIPMIQLNGAHEGDVIPSSVRSYIQNPGSGQPLKPQTRSFMEYRFGVDFSNVRVHVGAKASEAADALNAQAFTVGRNIFFGAEKYQPMSSSGRQLLGHELTHVVQQGSGVHAFEVGKASDTHEREADGVAGDISIGRKTLVSQKAAAPGVQRQVRSSGEGGTTSLSPNLLPPPIPAETEEERLNRMISEAVQEEEARRGIARPGESPAVSTAPASDQSLAEAVRQMLAKCKEEQRLAGEPRHRELIPPSIPLESKAGGTDPMAELKPRIEACLATKEGERVQQMAKDLLLSREGSPITVTGVAAYLAYILSTGKVPYIPSIPIGKELEVSVSLEGKVTQPEKVMVTLKFSGVPSWLRTVGRGLWGGIKAAGSGIWSGLKAIGHGLSTVGRATWTGLKAVGRTVWKGIEAAGRGIATAAGAVWTGIKWVSHQLWDKVTGIFERVAHWIARLPERVRRLLLGLWEGVKSLKPWSLDWWKSLSQATTWLNLLKWLGTRLIDLLEIAGVGEIYETVADFIKFNTRKLTDGEIRKASTVFGSSINFSLVRVDEGAVLGPAFSKRPYTSFHTINAWGGMTDDTLMHELTHVWQYEQAGAIYMPQAIHGQVSGGGYDYKGVPGLKAARGRGITSFNREQQAQIVEDFYRIKTGLSPFFGSGTRADLPLYAHFVKDVSTLTESQLIT